MGSRFVQRVALLALVICFQPLISGSLPHALAETDQPEASATQGKKSKTFQAEEAEIPKTTTTPPTIGYSGAPPEDPFHCERKFSYKGRTLICDSHVEEDGERLRPIVQDVPAAVNELNAYQANRLAVKNAAYIGSLGLLVIIGGVIAWRFFLRDEHGGATSTGIAVRNATTIAGLGIVSGTFVYGFSMLKVNENHLGTAVQNYNQAHPENPIELKFSTGIAF